MVHSGSERSASMKSGVHVWAASGRGVPHNASVRDAAADTDQVVATVPSTDGQCNPDLIGDGQVPVISARATASQQMQLHRSMVL